MRWMSWVGALALGFGAAAGDGRVPEAAMVAMERLYPEVPAAENGALKFLVAYDALVHPDDGADAALYAVDAAGFPSPLAAIPDDVAEAMAAHVGANGESLVLLREGSGYTRFRYPVDFSEGEHVGLAHMARLREVARLSGLNAVVAALRGDGEAAVRAVGDAAAITRSLTAEPNELSQLTRYFCGEITFLAMEHVVNRVVLDDEAFTALQRVAASLEEPASLVATLEGVKWMASLPQAPEVETDDDWESALELIGDISGKVDLGTAPTETVDEGEAAVDPAVAQREARLAEAVAYLDRLDMPLEDLYEFVRYPAAIDPDAPSAVSSQAFGPLRRPVLAYIRFMARARVAQTAVTVERYRLAKGALPEKLADLVPDYVLSQTLIDPCGGSGLRYAVEEDRVVVYSVADAVFNAKAKREAPDAVSAISFRVGR